MRVFFCNIITRMSILYHVLFSLIAEGFTGIVKKF